MEDKYLENFFKSDFVEYEKKRERYETFFDKDTCEERNKEGFYCEATEEEEEVFGQTEHERWESYDERLTSIDMKKINRSFKKIDKYVSEQELFGDRLKKMELLYKENEVTGEVVVRKIRNSNQRRERVGVLLSSRNRVAYDDTVYVSSLTDINDFKWD